MLTGGTARNQMMVRYLRQSIPGLVIPEQAPYFEAYGAALWALENETGPFPGMDKLFSQRRHTFDQLPPLSQFEQSVTFKSIRRAEVRSGDVCLLGLDVGSTTTKAVLVRNQDNALLASVYLRTNGDPVGASRQCYQHILEQVEEHCPAEQIDIIGIGVCGSGRQIAGLHAMTDGVINEILAHAVAAVYFDPDVDTIFEIGGQDAKYTYITNGVPSDYAMNEACSAGTGSFLEESALETLGIPMEKIAETALKGQSPPNFNDQCAAFIASDIKNAIHEGVDHADIVAGLVYSICMNYNNRVKGNRQVGKKVFMQGGVCYNSAIPRAMASLSGKPIIVPPEPGLMGAFGAALEIKKRFSAGLMEPAAYDLKTLANRTVSYGEPFICKGGKERCDRRCEISRIEIEGTIYPFGGACNRYDNLRRNKKIDTLKLDLVRKRQELVFGKYAPVPLNPDNPLYKGRIGINRSFLVNTYYPLYAHFFSALGFEPLLPDAVDPNGIEQRNAPFCYPVELAHGFFHNLITRDQPPGFIFLPHFKAIPDMNGDGNAQVCPLVQAETFYLQTTFRDRLQQLAQKPGVRVFQPMMDLGMGLDGARKPLVETAAGMGISRKNADAAFNRALAVMETCLKEMQEIGRDALAELENKPDDMAVVLFSRPYNGFAPEAHMGIPHKFATRGIRIIPLDFLDMDGESIGRHMYWGMGQRILSAGRLVERHPQLFGTYITNFSCGPDSFLVGYFRSIMGRKPSLTLELDSHTADAGLETRIEAFLDVVNAYRRLDAGKHGRSDKKPYRPAQTQVKDGAFSIVTSDGRTLPHTDPSVTLVFPSMGQLGTPALAAAFESVGFHTHACEPGDEAILKLGRGNTSCKECLPLILTTGLLLDYIQNRKRRDETVLYFMPTGSGPCRFGQYYIFMEHLVHKMRIPDVAMFSISSDDGYSGLPSVVHRRSWWAVVVSDVFEDIRAMLLANARQPEEALVLFHDLYADVVAALRTGQFPLLEGKLIRAARELKRIPLKQPVSSVPIISITGEIYVRRDNLSRQYLTEYLAARGFAAVCAPVAEWVLYSDYVVRKGLSGYELKGLRQKIKALLKEHVMRKDEKRIKAVLSRSGLVHAEPVDIEAVLRTAAPYISPYLGGEAVLTVGSSLREVAEVSCGVIAIGPFGCMPNRISEAILGEGMKRSDKLAGASNSRALRATLADVDALPFLAIESDGSPFPQLIHAKLEAFCLRAERMHARMLANRYAN